MTTANLPMRYEISNTTGTGTLRKICCSAISEGGYNPVGFIFSASQQITNVVKQTETALFALKINSGTSDRTTVIPTSFDIVNQSTTTAFRVRIYLYLSPTTNPVNNIPVETSVTYSNCLYGFGKETTIATGGIILYEAFAQSNAKGSTVSGNLLSLNNVDYLSKNIEGLSDYYVISVYSYDNNNNNFLISVQWTEIN
jgi:hypothetical protein